MNGFPSDMMMPVVAVVTAGLVSAVLVVMAAVVMEEAMANVAGTGF